MSSTKARVLVLGASGLLGRTLFSILKEDFEVIGTRWSNTSLDENQLTRTKLTNTKDLQLLLDSPRPDFVVNCAGLTSVEDCERKPEASWILNAYLPINVAELLSGSHVKFIQISTDHFASKNQTPRSETEEVWSVNQYGYAKLFAEKAIMNIHPSSIVVRTNFFGLGKKNNYSILDFAVNSLQLNQMIKGFADVYFSPVGVTFLSSAIAKLLQTHYRGILNVSSSECISKYEFMTTVAETLGMNSRFISSVSISESSRLVTRPNYLALNPSLFHSELEFPAPSIREMIKQEISKEGRARRAHYATPSEGIEV